MVISKEILSGYKELWDKAMKLVQEESRDDPPTDPYRSHYKARDVLNCLKKQLDDELLSMRASEADGTDDELCCKTILAFVCRDLGRIHIYVDETGDGEKLLLQCIDLIEPLKQRGEGIIPYLGAVNELSILLASHQEYKRGAELLLKADKSYEEFKDSGVVPLSIGDLYNPPDEPQEAAGQKELESLYTLCCFYLAQMYGQLEDPAKSAEYCHRTLKRQLQYKSYDNIDFALNTATLSQYYIGVERFKEARHHLAAATLIMAEHETNMLQPHMTEQQRKDITETFKHRYADVARCWAKYGLHLLHTSKIRLMRDDDEDNDGDNDLTKAIKHLALADGDYRFLELDLSACESRIACDYCLTFDDAKLVFHFVNEWLDVAKDYYKAETEATEYAKIMQDYAEAYEYIAFFEEVPENQAKMQKRRAKYLEDLLDLLDQTYFLKICRECWYGAGTANTAILDIRMDLMKSNNTPTPDEIKKVNQTCAKAIKHFKSFINSYMTSPDSGVWRSNMDVEEQRTVLYAHFHIGRLYYKFITGNPLQQLEHIEHCFKHYKLFNDECEARKEAAQLLHGEIGVVREMLELLPLKIDAIKARLQQPAALAST